MNPHKGRVSEERLRAMRDYPGKVTDLEISLVVSEILSRRAAEGGGKPVAWWDPEHDIVCISPVDGWRPLFSAPVTVTEAVRVKPLEWEGSDAARMWYAHSVFGYYDVARDGDVWRFGCGSLVVGRNFSTSEKAKEAAQFAYEQIILSALNLQASP